MACSRLCLWTNVSMKRHVVVKQKHTSMVALYTALILETDFNLSGCPPIRNIKRSILKRLSCRLLQPEALALVLSSIRSMYCTVVLLVTWLLYHSCVSVALCSPHLTVRRYPSCRADWLCSVDPGRYITSRKRFHFHQFFKISRSTQPNRSVRICLFVAGGDGESWSVLCVSWELYENGQLIVIYTILVHKYFKVRKLFFENWNFFTLKNYFMKYSLFMDRVVKT